MKKKWNKLVATRRLRMVLAPGVFQRSSRVIRSFCAGEYFTKSDVLRALQLPGEILTFDEQKLRIDDCIRWCLLWRRKEERFGMTLNVFGVMPQNSLERVRCGDFRGLQF